jgi:hypothetical protein
MGSIAMDSFGNMALGYSASNATTTFPSSWYTGRLAGDPLGTMPQGEASIINGTGSQTGGSSRWGDYTSLNVDPVDDCTFWYVNEWVPVTSSAGWQLRVGAFQFPDCGGVQPMLHVGDLDRKAKNVAATWRAQVKTTVHDDGHAVESGVLVNFSVSGGVGNVSCTTTGNGICEVSVVVPDSVPSLTFVVTNLSKGGFVYDPASNHDPDPDSNGTTIVVNQP